MAGMIHNTEAGGLNAQCLRTEAAVSAHARRPAPLPGQGQPPGAVSLNGDQTRSHGLASGKGVLNNQNILQPNMVRTGSLQRPLSQVGHSTPVQEMAFGMSSLSGQMPQLFLQGLAARQPGLGAESPPVSNGLPLMNVDVSSSNFLKAINFDAMSNWATTSGISETQIASYQNGAPSEYHQSESAQEMEQNSASEPNVDLLEQQQTTAQAQLLDRFKQLRQWQASQQELLMRQQQEQLAVLREEQSRVQMLLVKQRENQWGAPGVTTHNSPVKSPTKTFALQQQSSLPYAIAQSTLALAKLNRPTGATSGETLQQQSTPPTVQRGRPVPNIASGPSTPLEYLEHGNPNLDSDSNTVTSGTPLEDGINRLADTASECSEAPGQSAAYFHSKNDVSEEERQERENTGTKYGPPIPFPPVDEEDVRRQKLFGNEMHMNGAESKESLDESHPVKADDQQAFTRDQNHLTHQQVHLQMLNGGKPLPRHDDTVIRQNHVLDFREVNCNSNKDQDPDEMEQEASSEEQDAFLDEEELRQQEKEQEIDQKTEESERAMNLEDKPVVGTKKTFEELLEEELQKEESRKQISVANTQQSSEVKGPQRKTFLRRREGLARFGVHNSKTTEKKQVSKSSSQVENQSSKPKGRSTKPSNKQTSSAVNNKKDNKQNKTVMNSMKTSPQANKTSASSAPSKGVIHSKSAKLQLKVPPAGKSTSPQKSHLATGHKLSTSSNMVTAESKPVTSCSKSKDSTGEMSFQRCMQDREKYEEIESEELQEFEILEQFADDNASFLSNVSVVNKVLSEEKKAKASQPCSSSRSVQSVSEQFKAQSLSEDTESEDELDNTLQGSSPEQIQKIQVNKVYPGTLQRKVSQLESRSPSKTVNAESVNRHKQIDDSDVWEEFEGTDGGQISDNAANDTDQSDSSSSSEEDESSDTDKDVGFDVKDIILHSQLSDRYAGNNKVSNNNSHPVQSNHPSEICKEASNGQSVSSPNEADSFGDDDEWEDPDELQVQGQVSGVAPSNSGPIVKTKVFPEQNGTDKSNVSTTPPTSKLVTKLFPKLKQEKRKCSPVVIEQQEQMTAVKQVPLGDGVQSKALRDKLVELEREIERFRKENANLEALRREREEGLEHLKKEMAEFEKQKSAELQRLQEYKNEEMKKLKKERRVFEQYQKASKGRTDKKDREEIELLKKQLSELQEELKQKEHRWMASTSRLRDRLDYIERENAELKEEIKLLEKKRLEAWQQKDTLLPVKNDKKQDMQQTPGVHQFVASQKTSDTQLSNSQAAPRFAEMQTSRSLPHTQISQHTATNIVCDKAIADSINDLQDSSSQAVAELNLTNDESLIMQTVPQAMSRGAAKHVNSNSQQATVSVATATNDNKVTMARKTAIAVNISQTVDKGDEKYEELQHADGKIERIYTNGAREILFSNGTRKQVSADGQSIIVSFFNGDVKQIMPDQRVVYYYADAQTTHTTYPDGLEIIQFPNGQVEKHYPDGTREITFPDQTIKYLFPTGVEESIFPDGTVIRVERNGDKVMEFPNGQREIHTPQYKRREYPDGTVKTVYPDGRQETRYSSGRIRVKDRDGQVIIDRRL